MSSPAFWEDGLRFKCQGCGKCCQARGSYGYVYLTARDRKRLAETFGISQQSFTKKYCSRTDGLFHLKNPSRDCSFFSEKGCTVYSARPEQCRTWPFWPENMNARIWRTKIAAFCPGIGKGRIHSAEEIRESLARDPVDGDTPI